VLEQHQLIAPDVKLGKNAKGFTILAKGAETYGEEEK
jgi:hypothetical protein